MNIKAKLSLGLGFLFAVILLLGGMGIYYLNNLSFKSKEILKDNYESLLYVKNMLQALDETNTKRQVSLTAFEVNLADQEKNTTEIGEKEATVELRREFNFMLKDTSISSIQLNSVRQKLFKINDINLQAIVRKNLQANQSSENAIVYMTLIGTISILVAFTFIVSFPGYIAGPIKELTEGIKEITNKNYEQRLHFKSDDEFGELATAFNAMALKMDEYEHSNLAEILFQKKRIETIINNMHDPIIGLDENKYILFANTEALNLLALFQQDIINKYAPDIALQNDLLRTLLNSDSSIQLKIFSGEKESYFTKEKIEITSDLKLIGTVIILKNVTSFKELDAAKTNFIATISHELKTPIASIQMCTTLLQDGRIGDLNTEQKQILETVKDENQRLLRITSELLDLAQVETGNISLHYQEINPKELVEYAYKALKFQAEQKQVTIEIEGISEQQVLLLPRVNADFEKTAWVMVNLLSNAIRYSPEKSKIIIEVKPETDKVTFSVTDLGKGIDPKHKEKIFDKFFKVPGSETVGSSGTGLGLAISKEFITAQGGEIWVDSTPEKGSTFSFKL